MLTAEMFDVCDFGIKNPFFYQKISNITSM